MQSGMERKFNTRKLANKNYNTHVIMEILEIVKSIEALHWYLVCRAYFYFIIQRKLLDFKKRISKKFQKKNNKS